MTQQNAIAHILEQMAALEAAYQRAKKDLASILDKYVRTCLSSQQQLRSSHAQSC